MLPVCDGNTPLFTGRQGPKMILLRAPRFTEPALINDEDDLT